MKSRPGSWNPQEYSADFYTRGRALLASSPDDVVRMAHVDKQEYFAMSPRCLILVPDELRSRFEQVGEQNATALYRIRVESGDPHAGADHAATIATPNELQAAKDECLTGHPP